MPIDPADIPPPPTASPAELGYGAVAQAPRRGVSIKVVVILVAGLIVVMVTAVIVTAMAVGGGRSAAKAVAPPDNARTHSTSSSPSGVAKRSVAPSAAPSAAASAAPSAAPSLAASSAPTTTMAPKPKPKPTAKSKPKPTSPRRHNAGASQALVITDDGGAPVAHILLVSATHYEGAETDISGPPANGHYLRFTVTIKALAPQRENEFDWFYQTADGKRYDTTAGNGVFAGDDNALGSPTLNTDESITATLTFDMPSKAGTLVYAPLGQAQASWVIS